MKLPFRFTPAFPFIAAVAPTLDGAIAALDKAADDLEVVSQDAIARINAAQERILVEKLVIVGAEEVASRAVRVQARIRELTA